MGYLNSLFVATVTLLTLMAPFAVTTTFAQTKPTQVETQQTEAEDKKTPQEKGTLKSPTQNNSNSNSNNSSSEKFDPSEQISEDLSVPFPTDI